MSSEVFLNSHASITCIYKNIFKNLQDYTFVQRKLNTGSCYLPVLALLRVGMWVVHALTGFSASEFELLPVDILFLALLDCTSLNMTHIRQPEIYNFCKSSTLDVHVIRQLSHYYITIIMTAPCSIDDLMYSGTLAQFDIGSSTYM